MKRALTALCKISTDCANYPNGCNANCIKPSSLMFLSLDVECALDCPGYFGDSSYQQITTMINEAVRAAPRQIPLVMYSDRPDWNKYLGPPRCTTSPCWGGPHPQNPYSKCPLWDAVPDTVDDLTLTEITTKWGDKAFVPRTLYGGWNEKTRFAKQYEYQTGEDARALGAYTGIASLDLDTLSWNPWKTPCFGGGVP